MQNLNFETHYKNCERTSAVTICGSASTHISLLRLCLGVASKIWNMLTRVLQERRWGRRSRLQWPSLVSRRLRSPTTMFSTSSAQRTVEDRWAWRTSLPSEEWVGLTWQKIHFAKYVESWCFVVMWAREKVNVRVCFRWSWLPWFHFELVAKNLQNV